MGRLVPTHFFMGKEKWVDLRFLPILEVYSNMGRFVQKLVGLNQCIMGSGWAFYNIGAGLGASGQSAYPFGAGASAGPKMFRGRS